MSFQQLEKSDFNNNNSQIDDQQLQEALERELAEMKVENDNQSMLNQSSDSIQNYRNYANNQFGKMNEQSNVQIYQTQEWKDLMQKTAKREEMLGEMQAHINELKKLTAIPEDNQNNISIISTQTNKESQNHQTLDNQENQKQSKQGPQPENQAISKDQLQEIQNRVAQEYETQVIVFSQDIVEKRFKQENVLLESSIDSQYEEVENLNDTKSKLKNTGQTTVPKTKSSLSNHSRIQVDQQSSKIFRSSVSQINSTQNELQQQLQRMNEEREQFQMEKQDAFSREVEEWQHQQKFEKRNWCLPQEFPSYRQESNVPSQFNQKDNFLQFIHPKRICLDGFKPLQNQQENLAPQNSKDICFQHLRRVFVNINQQPEIQISAVRPNTSSNSSSSSQSNLKTQQNLNTSSNSNNISSEDTSYFKETIIIKVNSSADLGVRAPNDSQTGTQQNKNCIRQSLNQTYFYKILSFHAEIVKKVKSSSALNSISTLASQFKAKILSTLYDENAADLGGNLDQQYQMTSNDKTDQSLKNFIENSILYESTKMKKLEVKLQRISDLSGLENVPNLLTLILSVNNLQSIKEVGLCQNLIELNLSQNKIQDYTACGQLSELRLLNLEMNIIRKMCVLKNCQRLEVLNLNNNQIAQIENIEDVCLLKKLLLFRNQISDVAGLEKMNLLEELDLGRNAVKIIHQGLEKCLLLRKLVLYQNQIEKLPANFHFFFLTELYLNGNKLTDLSGIGFMPCLEYLNLQENRIQTTINENQVIVLPNLLTLLLSYNRISAFTFVWNIVRYTPNLQNLSYVENPFLVDITPHIHQLFEFSFYKLLPNLVEINLQKIDTGHQKFLEARFAPILKETKKHQMRKFLTQEASDLYQDHLSGNLGLFDGFMNKFCTFSSEYVFMNKIENRLIMKSHPFAFTLDYVNHKNKSKYQHLNQTCNEPKNFEAPLKMNQSIFYLNDIFTFTFRKSILIIQRFFLQSLRKLRKIKAYYLKNIKRVIQSQAFIRGFLLRKRFSMKTIGKNKKFQAQAQFAIKIQKVFRGYRFRKKMKNAFQNIKFEEDEDMPEFDDGWLNQNNDFQTELKIPDNFDINAFFAPAPQGNFPPSSGNSMHLRHNTLAPLPPPTKQYPQSMEENQFGMIKKAISEKDEYSNVGQEDNQEDFMYNSNQTFKSAKTKISSNTQQDVGGGVQKGKHRPGHLNQVQSFKISGSEQEQIMEDWGFKKDETAAAFLFRLEKDRQRKIDQNKKQLSAAERYEKFLNLKK